jgi:hypothetical protein
MTRRRSFLGLALAMLTAGVVLLATAPVAGASQAPEVIRFEKQFDPVATALNGTPTWTGTVPGGTLEVRLVDYSASGAVEHIVVDFIVVGPTSFTARVGGIFNTKTERTALNGQVTSGMFEGARVHEEGLRVDAATSRFVGTIWIMRGSAA